MRTLALVFFNVLTFATANCQGFNRRYDFDQNNMGGLLNDVELQSDGYLIFGTSNDSLGESIGLWVLKVSYSGETQWEKSYFKTPEFLYAGWCNSVDISDPDNYILGGSLLENESHCMLVEFDAFGDTIWSKTYTPEGLNYSVGYNAIRNSDGDYLIAGFAGIMPHDSAFLLKVDQNGNEIWHNVYPITNYVSVIGSIIETQNGYMLGGQSIQTDSGQLENNFLINVDELGTELWRQSYGDLGFDDPWVFLENGPNNSIILAGGQATYDMNDIAYTYPYVLKVNENGSVLWSNTYGPSSLDNILQSVKSVPGGGYVCAGISTNSGINYEGLLLRIAENGDSLWMRRYSSFEGNHSFLYDVIPAENGNFVAVGYAYPDAENNVGVDGWVIKTDEYGCIIPGCEVGIDELDISAELMIYPNPAVISTNIYLKTKE
jgi:hypothetical protein